MIDFAAELRRVFGDFLRQTVDAAPSVAVGVVVGLVGIIAAWLLERLVIALMRRQRVSKMLKRIGFADWLARAGVKRSPAHFLGRVAFWVVLLLLVRTAAYAFNLVPISQALGTFLGYLPSLFAAVLIILLGSVLARGAAAIVRQGTEGAGADVAASTAAVVYGARDVCNRDHGPDSNGHRYAGHSRVLGDCTVEFRIGLQSCVWIGRAERLRVGHRGLSCPPLLWCRRHLGAP